MDTKFVQMAEDISSIMIDFSRINYKNSRLSTRNVEVSVKSLNSSVLRETGLSVHQIIFQIVGIVLEKASMFQSVISNTTCLKRGKFVVNRAGRSRV